MIRALAISKSFISDLRICPRNSSGIPSYVFDASDKIRYSAAISTQSINVFRDLTSLDLKIALSGDEPFQGSSGSTLPDLTKLLTSMHGLVNLALTFLSNAYTDSYKWFDLKDIFGPLDQYKWGLCFLYLSGLTATQNDQQDFLKRQSDMENMSLANFELLDGDWATMLEKIKALSLPLKEFSLIRLFLFFPIMQCGGLEVVSWRKWDDLALDTSVPQYVLDKNGGDGLNPLRKLINDTPEPFPT